MLLIYLIFSLVGINLLGVDPADILLIFIVPIILLKDPTNIFLIKLSMIPRILLFTFMSFFIISIYNGYEFRFVAAASINLLLFFLIYFTTLYSDKNTKIGYAICVPFIVINVLFFVIGTLNLDIGSSIFQIFRDGRYLGSMGDPNFTGFLAVLCALYFLDKLIYAEKSTLNIVLLILSISILLLSESRAAWAAALIGLIVYFPLMRGRQHLLVLPVVFIFLLVSLALSFGDAIGAGQFGNVAGRATTIFVQADTAEAERFAFVYTRASLLVGLDHPLGVGPGKTVSYTGLVNADGDPIGAHNAFVQILAENGWGALLCLLAVLCAAVAKLWRRAVAGWMLNDISCRVILSMVAAQVIFAMAHDMIAWRVAWVIPSLAICAAFASEMSSTGRMRKARRSFFPAASVPGLGGLPWHRSIYD